MDFPFTKTAGCLDAKVHETKAITYGKQRKALSQWMAPYVGKLNAPAFLSTFGTKFGRAGGASAACNSGLPKEIWQEQGGWKTDVRFRYVQRSKTAKQAVGRAIMTPTSQPSAAPVAEISQSAGLSRGPNPFDNDLCRSRKRTGFLTIRRKPRFLSKRI